MAPSLGAWVLLFVAATAALAAADKPNFVIIVADDLGYGDLGYTGSAIRTPNIDALAKNGTIMGSYYVNLCCTPTRSMLMTGRYSMRFGLQTGVIPNNKAYGLFLNETTTAQHLKTLGYQTHALGKWHLGLYNWLYTPTFRGFDSFYGYYGGSEDYFTHKNSGMDLHLDVGANCGKGCSQPQWDVYSNYSTPLYGARAAQVISEHDPSTGPLFLYAAFQAVHAPIEAPDSYVKPYMSLAPERRVFAGMLACLDEAVGTIVAALKAKGIFENTGIIFTTDNGAPQGASDHQPRGIGTAVGGQNWPLRGGKGAYFEGGVRGASWVYGDVLVSPERRGTTNHELAHVTDWLPTLVAAASGGRVPEDFFDAAFPLDGVSQYDMLKNNQPSARETVLINIERSNPTTAFCVGCGATAAQCNGVPQYAAIKGRHKILVGGGGLPNVWYHDGLPYNGSAPTPQDQCLDPCVAPGTHGCLSVPMVQVYDVIADPSERNDLSANATLVEELMAVVRAYNATPYIDALPLRTPVENKCPFNDARGALTPCDP